MVKYSHLFMRIFTLIVAVLFLGGCKPSQKAGGTSYKIDVDTQGYIEVIDNIENMSIVSIDRNHYKAEYEAGFIQGKLQNTAIIATRDNLWDSAFLTDQTPTFAKQIPPSTKEIEAARVALLANLKYTLSYMQKTSDKVLRTRIQRLFYRMLGIYHGVTRNKPAALKFGSEVFPLVSYFTAKEMTLGYETAALTFMDVYFINGFMDLFDVLDSSHNTRCSAFVKKTGGDIIIAHNSWMSFLDQSSLANLYINGDYLSINFAFAGLLGSETDFGYNNKGILFNETTHHATFTIPKTDALWMYLRAALAEQFAGSLDEFYELISLEASGTYMNGYMVVDTKTKEIGLIEMSYKSFVYFKPDGKNGYQVITKPDGLSKDYDTKLLQPNYIIGVNYPVSKLIVSELKATDTRPLRRVQFLARIGGINDIESAKKLITYTAPNEPLSIYGRWDLGYGTTPYPQTIPDGAADAKAITAKMISYASKLKGELDLNAKNRSFWMKFGSAKIKGKPFIWSESQWKTQKLRDVPDWINGDFQYLNSYIK